MTISEAKDPTSWDSFLSRQRFRPFLQSWMMGEVYREIGQPPARLVAEENGEIQAICFGHIVDAKRGRHLSVPYGPVIRDQGSEIRDQELTTKLIDELKNIARSEKCSFIRLSPFWSQYSNEQLLITDPRLLIPHSVSSPLHLLAEQIWYLPLTTVDSWQPLSPPPAVPQNPGEGSGVGADEILMQMRKTTRNLIRRAERDGVEVTASSDPIADLESFITLHDETRKRHGFTPYTNAFFRAQVKHFAAKNQCTVYLARHQGQLLAASIHMHAFGETSYHHGASIQSKVPASYLLQWRAIQDALKRGDHVYNFWGIAPLTPIPNPSPTGGRELLPSPIGGGVGGGGKNHPFAGVTLFKTGFGGAMLPLVHCMDMPIKPTYWLTYAFETMRKWKRGF